jgi:hypothetical protein
MTSLPRRSKGRSAVRSRVHSGTWNALWNARQWNVKKAVLRSKKRSRERSSVLCWPQHKRKKIPFHLSDVYFFHDTPDCSLGGGVIYSSS